MTQNREKRAAEIGLVSALLCGFLVHLYGLVNAVHNYDDILQLPKGYGAGVTLGRWFLILGDFCEKYLDLGYNNPKCIIGYDKHNFPATLTFRNYFWRRFKEAKQEYWFMSNSQEWTDIQK